MKKKIINLILFWCIEKNNEEIHTIKNNSKNRMIIVGKEDRRRAKTCSTLKGDIKPSIAINNRSQKKKKKKKRMMMMMKKKYNNKDEKTHCEHYSSYFTR